MVPPSGSPGSPDAPEVLARIEAAAALVGPVARQLKAELAAPRLPDDDLVSFGSEGALAAGRTFDPSLRVPFERWATLKIRGKILDGLRARAMLPRRLYRRLRMLSAAHDSEEGAVEDDAARTAESAEAADARLSDRLAAMATSMAMGSLFVSDEETLNAVEDERGTPEDEAIREELRARVRAAVAGRPEQERKMLEGYYFQGKTLEQASGGLSRSWSSRLLARATVGVAKALQRSGH